MQVSKNLNVLSGNSLGTLGKIMKVNFRHRGHVFSAIVSTADASLMKDRTGKEAKMEAHLNRYKKALQNIDSEASQTCPMSKCKYTSKHPANLKDHILKHVSACLKDGIYRCSSDSGEIPETQPSTSTQNVSSPLPSPSEPCAFECESPEDMFEHLRTIHRSSKKAPKKLKVRNDFDFGIGHSELLTKFVDGEIKVKRHLIDDNDTDNLEELSGDYRIANVMLTFAGETSRFSDVFNTLTVRLQNIEKLVATAYALSGAYGAGFVVKKVGESYKSYLSSPCTHKNCECSHKGILEGGKGYDVQEVTSNCFAVGTGSEFAMKRYKDYCPYPDEKLTLNLEELNRLLADIYQYAYDERIREFQQFLDLKKKGVQGLYYSNPWNFTADDCIALSPYYNGFVLLMSDNEHPLSSEYEEYNGLTIKLTNDPTYLYSRMGFTFHITFQLSKKIIIVAIGERTYMELTSAWYTVTGSLDIISFLFYREKWRCFHMGVTKRNTTGIRTDEAHAMMDLSEILCRFRHYTTVPHGTDVRYAYLAQQYWKHIKNNTNKALAAEERKIGEDFSKEVLVPFIKRGSPEKGQRFLQTEGWDLRSNLPIQQSIARI